MSLPEFIDVTDCQSQHHVHHHNTHYHDEENKYYLVEQCVVGKYDRVCCVKFPSHHCHHLHQAVFNCCKGFHDYEGECGKQWQRKEVVEDMI